MRKAGLILGVVVAAGLVWQFGLKPRMQRYEAWEGTLVDAYRLYNPNKKPPSVHASEDFCFDYFWRVELDSGEERDYEIPMEKWGLGKLGEAVVKVSGELFPRMADDGGTGDVEAYMRQQEQQQAPPAMLSTEPTEAPVETAPGELPIPEPLETSPAGGPAQ